MNDSKIIWYICGNNLSTYMYENYNCMAQKRHNKYYFTTEYKKDMFGMRQCEKINLGRRSKILRSWKRYMYIIPQSLTSQLLCKKHDVSYLCDNRQTSPSLLRFCFSIHLIFSHCLMPNMSFLYSVPLS
jgi:hypothetical protein